MSTPLITRPGLHRIDTNQLLHSGAVEGPFRRTRPLTLTWRVRFARWVRHLTTTRSPL